MRSRGVSSSNSVTASTASDAAVRLARQTPESAADRALHPGHTGVRVQRENQHVAEGSRIFEQADVPRV